MNNKKISGKDSQLIMYQTDDGSTKIDVSFDGDTVWLSLDQMAELFQRDKSTVSRHIKNVFDEGELKRDSTVANFATVQIEGDRQIERNIDYYNLDVIIFVGDEITVIEKDYISALENMEKKLIGVKK